MAFIKDLKIEKEIETILKTKYSSLFCDFLYKLFDNPKYIDEIINNNKLDKFNTKQRDGQSMWISIFTNITSKFFRKIPLLAYKLLACRASDQYKLLRRIAKKNGVTIDDVSRHYKIKINTFLQNYAGRVNIKEPTKNSFFKNTTLQFGRFTLKDGNLNLLKNNKLIKRNTMGSNIGLPGVGVQYDDEEENKMKYETHLDSIKKKNKLNIYIGEYETYTAKKQINIEKIKIYEGKLCSSFFLNRNLSQKKLESVTSDKIDIRKIIKKDGGIFIPNDINKNRRKDLIKMKLLGKISVSPHEKNNESPLKKNISMLKQSREKFESSVVSVSKSIKLKKTNKKILDTQNFFNKSDLYYDQ